MWEDHYYARSSIRRPGGSLPDGEEGELVLTTLTREGLPLVRYRTHDLTRVVSRGAVRLRPDAISGWTASAGAPTTWSSSGASTSIRGRSSR